MSNNVTQIIAAGDVCVDRDDPDSAFELVTPTIRAADIAFCQLESTFSERGAPLPAARVPIRAHPKNATAIKNAGFQVVSAAGNHCMDWGLDAFFDTIETLKNLGLEVIGVGKDISKARRPITLTHNGNKITFLAYNSILPNGYWALPDRPGCCPLRGLTLYQPTEVGQPGTLADTYTFVLPEDLAAMKEDVKKAKADSDVVIVSLHFDIHFAPAVLAMYQLEAAHAAIDAGADLILGHHAHILKGIEVYKGKAIFYSLCNFVFDIVWKEQIWESHSIKGFMLLHPGWKKDTETSYPFPPDSRKTILAKCIISDKHIERVSFLPVMINERLQPEVCPRADERSSQVVEYIEKIGHDQGLDTRFSWEEDEVVIHT